MTKALKELLEKVEATTGRVPSAIVDNACAVLFGRQWTLSDWAMLNMCVNKEPTSLDAAKALHEALLPGWRVACVRQGDGQDVTYHGCDLDDWFVNLFSKDYGTLVWEAGDRVTIDILSGTSADAWSSAPARAWLIAILKAKIAESEDQ